jgi:chitinase
LPPSSSSSWSRVVALSGALVALAGASIVGACAKGGSAPSVGSRTGGAGNAGSDAAGAPVGGSGGEPVADAGVFDGVGGTPTGGVGAAGMSGEGTGGASAGTGDASVGTGGAPTGAAGASGGAGGAASDAGAVSDASPPAPSGVRLVGYLPNYNGSYASWAKKIDFTKMTHLNLAFALATSSNGWDMGASNADVKAIVDAAHAAGVKVLASLGGGGGDQTVLARYNDPNSVGPLVDNLDAFLKAHDFDGADIDIESPNNLGQSFSTFVTLVIAKLHPEGKLVTAAVAQYLQDSMADATLHAFDFINVMIYSSLSQTMKDATYYAATKKVPKNLVVLGAGFFGDGGNNEYAYADIIKADSTAWSKDTATVGGTTVHYEGMATTKQIADYAKGFGGVMIWELTEDTFDAHSLYKVIQGEL